MMTAEIPKQLCGHESGLVRSRCVVIGFANSPRPPISRPECFDPPVTNERVTAVYDLLYRNALVIMVQKPQVNVISSKRLQTAFQILLQLRRRKPHSPVSVKDRMSR